MDDVQTIGIGDVAKVDVGPEEIVERMRAWRKANQEGELHELPNSGLVMRLRRVSLLDLAEAGGIPAPLVGKVEEVIERDVEIKLEDFSEYAAVINLVVKAAVIFPVVADAPSEAAIGVQELPIFDRMAIFGWANEGTQALRPFRG